MKLTEQIHDIRNGLSRARYTQMEEEARGCDLGVRLGEVLGRELAALWDAIEVLAQTVEALAPPNLDVNLRRDEP